MYFVSDEDVLARYTGDEEWDLDDLPVDAVCFDYDDESKWTDNKLKKEAARTEDEDEDAFAAVEMELRRRTGLLSVPEFDDWDDLVSFVENYMADTLDRRPLFLLEDLSLPVRKKIRDVAKIAREEIAFRKKDKSSVDYEELDQQIESLVNRGWKAREKLLDSELGDDLLDVYDPIEQMKMMAGQMLFLYAESRLKAETEGGKPDEDFFYAGANLYSHAVADQIHEEDEDDDEDDDVDFDAWEAFQEYLKSAAGKTFDEEMDESTEAFLREKGYDISTLAGAKAAQKFLENAGPEDAFWTEGPVDNEMDEYMGRMRIGAMLECVKARIEKMIRKG